jgi:hypothetical protein
MLNGTLCATERALCCLVENYQTPEVRCVRMRWGCSDLFVGPTNSRTTPAIYARPRLPSLGERATEELAAKTGLRWHVLVVQRTGPYLEVHLFMYPQL